MLFAHGWAIIQSSREIYTNAKPGDLDEIDEKLAINDKKLHNDFKVWISENKDQYLVYSFHEYLNHCNGFLQFTIARNHRSSCIWDLINWLASSSSGTYGITYVHDDEDIIGLNQYGRGKNDYSNEFRVWRVLKGEVMELEDKFLSPIVPTILPNFDS